MIGVIGATGFTGRLVASELKKQNANFFLSARNEAALKELCTELGGADSRKINVQDKSTFNALAGCDVIINCAGPFTDLGESVVQEAIARQIHYLDLTGEQGFIKLVYDKYHEQAKSAGIALVPACAFEYAIGDSAGDILATTLNGCKQVEIVYYIQSTYTSAGTRKSIIRVMAAPSYQYQNGQLIKSAPAAIVKTAEIDGRKMSLMSFPAGEVLMLPKHTNLQEINAFMAVDTPAFLLPAVAMLLPPLLRLTANLFIKTADSGGSPSVVQRQGTRFTISVKANSATASGSIDVSGNDPYLLTAVIAVAAALHLERNGSANVGALSPAMLSTGKFFRELLKQAGVSWKENF